MAADVSLQGIPSSGHPEQRYLSSQQQAEDAILLRSVIPSSQVVGQCVPFITELQYIAIRYVLVVLSVWMLSASTRHCGDQIISPP